MSCNEIKILLASRKDLSAVEEGAVQRHLAGCAACAGYWRQEERTTRLLRGWPAPSRQAADRVTMIVDRRLAGSLPRRLPLARAFVGAGAMLAALILLVLLGPRLSPATTTPGGSAGSPGALQTTATQSSPVPGGSAGSPRTPQTTAAQPSPPPPDLLAYIHEGNLWTRALPDGPARQITTDGNNRGPRWAPSGAWLAYRKDTQLWVVQADGKEAQPVTNAVATHYAWSPTEDALAYATETGSLWVSTAPNWRAQELVIGGGSIMSGAIVDTFAWSPNGTTIAYSLGGIRANEGGEPQLYAGLWRIEADGTNATEVYQVSNPQGSGRGGQTVRVAGWSYDSQLILFWQPDSSASLAMDGVPLLGVGKNSGSPRTLVPSMLSHADFAAVSPVVHLVAVTTGSGRETVTDKRIAIVDLPSVELRYLTDDQVAALMPAWSEQGSQIAYVAAPQNGTVEERHIWLMASDGSDKQQLTRDPTYRDERPVWLNDSTQLLFARIDPQQQASLWLMRTNGSEQTRLADVTAPLEGDIYGHLPWEDVFAVWQPRAATPALPIEMPTSAPQATSARELAATATPLPAVATTGVVMRTHICTDPHWAYTISIPSSWIAEPPDGCEARFRDEETPQPGPHVDANDVGEDEFFAGGIGIRGKIAPSTDESAWLSMQPNHSGVVDWQPIDTPLGPGRVYTLDRDRARSNRIDADPTWRAQHAYIPVGDISYELWVQVGPEGQGAPVPVLAQMLASLQLIPVPVPAGTGTP